MKTVARYQNRNGVDNHGAPSVLVSASDYDSLSKDYVEAIGALRLLLPALLRSLEDKAVMNADEVIVQAETVLKKGLIES